MQAVLNVSHRRSKASRKPCIVYYPIARKSRERDRAPGFCIHAQRLLLCENVCARGFLRLTAVDVDVTHGVAAQTVAAVDAAGNLASGE